MRFKIIATIIFLCGFFMLLTSVMRSQKIQGQTIVEPRSKVIHYLASRSDGKSWPELYAYYTRAISATGEWKETRRTFQGETSTLVGAVDGLYIVNDDSRQLYGQSPVQGETQISAIEAENSLKTHPRLVRVEQLAGLTTYILRNEETGTEQGFSPQIGKTPLKLVVRDTPESTMPFFIQEAIAVEFRDLKDEEFRSPDNLLIQFDVAEQKVKSLRESGHQQRADLLEQAIHKLKMSGK